MSKDPTATPEPTTIFLDWGRPLIQQLIDYLLNSIGEDLSDRIIIVPTSESGRKLRKALASSGCKLAPRVVTSQFLHPVKEAGTVLASLYAWTKVLTDLDLDQARGLFPKDPPAGGTRGFRWAFNVAKQLHELELQLQNGQHSLSDIARIASNSPDAERWADIANLSEQVEQTKRGWKINDNVSYENIQEGSKIIIAGVTDLSHSAQQRLQSLLSKSTSVTVINHCSDKYPHGFDHWGRPLPSVWIDEPILLPHWQEQITLCEDPSLLADTVTRKIAQEQWQPEQLSLGLCDRDLATPVARSLSEAGWKPYDPEGSPIRSSSFLNFLRSLKQWLDESRPVSVLIDLLHLPQIEAFIDDDSLPRYVLIQQIDQIINKRLHLTTHDLLEHLENQNSEILQKVHQTILYFNEQTDSLSKGSAIRGLRGWIASALNRSDEATASNIAEDLHSIFNTLELIEKKEKRINLSQTLEILCEQLSNKKSYTDTSGTMIDLQSWMELLFEDSDNMLLLGMHEGVVPTGRSEDPFLSEPMRELLQLETSDFGYARDSYLFRNMIECRKKVFIYLSKNNNSNDPNKPSRLLMRTSGTELAQRVQKLFGESDILPENPSAWKRDWTLDLPEITNPYALENGETIKKLSPTALKEYLQCPLRFYLKRILKMERFEANKPEMNALDFGNLVHAVVEQFGRDTTIRDSQSEVKIATCFADLLEKEVFIRYGKNLSLAMRMQVDIAHKRLKKLAYHQAQQRQEGWKIINVELTVNPTRGPEAESKHPLTWNIADHPITMMIDRVDRHENSGAIRVLDYKTSGKAKTPKKIHLESISEKSPKPMLGEPLPSARSDLRWCNLQLPLYAWFAQQHYGTSEPPEVGFINLPNTLSDTGFMMWKEFNTTMLESAQQWATNAVQLIQAGNFHEPTAFSSKDQQYDDFAKLAQGDIAAAFGMTKEPNSAQ